MRSYYREISQETSSSQRVSCPGRLFRSVSYRNILCHAGKYMIQHIHEKRHLNLHRPLLPPPPPPPVQFLILL